MGRHRKVKKFIQFKVFFYLVRQPQPSPTLMYSPCAHRRKLKSKCSEISPPCLPLYNVAWGFACEHGQLPKWMERDIPWHMSNKTKKIDIYTNFAIEQLAAQALEIRIGICKHFDFNFHLRYPWGLRACAFSRAAGGEITE